MMDGCRTVPLTKGKVAIVDEADFETISAYSWWATWQGYAATTARIDGERYCLRMHRLIMGLKKGDPRQVDHINGDRSDNRRCNLRLCTPGENSRNSTAPVTNKCGHKGVSWHKSTGKWSAAIRVSGKKIHLGLYWNAEEAAKAYQRASLEYHGEFSIFSSGVRLQK